MTCAGLPMMKNSCQLHLMEQSGMDPSYHSPFNTKREITAAWRLVKRAYSCHWFVWFGSDHLALCSCLYSFARVRHYFQGENRAAGDQIYCAVLSSPYLLLNLADASPIPPYSDSFSKRSPLERRPQYNEWVTVKCMEQDPRCLTFRYATTYQGVKAATLLSDSSQPEVEVLHS